MSQTHSSRLLHLFSPDILDYFNALAEITENSCECDSPTSTYRHIYALLYCFVGSSRENIESSVTLSLSQSYMGTLVVMNGMYLSFLFLLHLIITEVNRTRKEEKIHQ